MTGTTETLFSEALALPPVERAALIEELLASFDSEVRTEVDRLWAVESEARLAAYDRDELSAHTLADVVAMINRQ